MADAAAGGINALSATELTAAIRVGTSEPGRPRRALRPGSTPCLRIGWSPGLGLGGPVEEEEVLRVLESLLRIFTPLRAFPRPFSNADNEDSVN